MSINSVNLVGRAGQDPDVRYFESGNVVCNFSLAVNRRQKNSQPDWFRIQLWGKTAEVAADYVRKGSLIGITGALDIEHWNDRQTGGDRSSPIIKGNQLSLLGSKADNQQAAQQQNYEEF